MSDDEDTGFPGFWSKVKKTETCWFWTAAQNYGYGTYQYKYKSYKAHRFAYLLLVGDIPNGLQLDHLCENRSCVNPKHLEAVTAKENTMRSTAASSINSHKDRCIKGHLYTNNVYYAASGRLCKICVKERNKMRYRN